jgi:hypothetical protein
MNLNPDKPKTISTPLVFIFLLAIAFITVVGFSMPVIAMSELSNKGFNPKSLIVFSFFLLIAVVGVDYLLISLLTRLLGVSTFDRFSTIMRSHRAHHLPTEPNVIQLPQQPAPFRSVTESTTRNFEPSPVRVRNTNE